MERILRLAVLTAFCVTLKGCNESGFSGGAKRQAPASASQPSKNRPKADKYFKLACENGAGEAKLVTQFTGASTTTVSLEGEFCGLPEKVAAGEVAVFFVLDMSGSMNDSDPLVNGSCGRLAAAQALVSKLSESVKAGVNVKAGLAVFGSDAGVAVPVTTLEQFRPTLTGGQICRQDGGSTNYEAAFTATKAALDNVRGQKIVYFISDGLPTVSNQVNRGGILGGGGPTPEFLNRVYSDGIRAAEALRSGTGVILDVIYLDSSQAKARAEQATGTQVEDPATYLEKIAGSKERVRLVTSAGELANQITTFDNPGEVTIKPDSVQGTVSAGALGSQEVQLKSITKDPNRPGVWLFVTEAFKLYSKAGSAIENQVTLTVNGADGKAYKAVALIEFATDD